METDQDPQENTEIESSGKAPLADSEVKTPAVVKNPDLKWYVINVYSGQEDRAKQALIESITREKVERFFGDIFVPKTVVEQLLKSGKKKLKEKTSYPGYLLVEMVCNEKSMSILKTTPKINGFVGDQKNPRPISEQEAVRLTSPEAAAERNKVASVVSFEKGESVKIIDGAFTNFDGIVDEVKPDRQKLRILVSIFGRETPVELDYHQVKKTI